VIKELVYFTAVKNLVGYAFAGCTNLVTFIMPNQITDAASHGWEGDTKLTNFKFSDNFRYITYMTFNRCSNLKIIEIPASVTQIGDYCLGDNQGIKVIVSRCTTPPSNTTSTPFRGCSNGGVLYVPKGCINNYSIWMQNSGYWLGAKKWTITDEEYNGILPYTTVL